MRDTAAVGNVQNGKWRILRSTTKQPNNARSWWSQVRYVYCIWLHRYGMILVQQSVCINAESCKRAIGPQYSSSYRSRDRESVNNHMEQRHGILNLPAQRNKRRASRRLQVRISATIVPTAAFSMGPQRSKTAALKSNRRAAVEERPKQIYEYIVMGVAAVESFVPHSARFTPPKTRVSSWRRRHANCGRSC